MSLMLAALAPRAPALLGIASKGAAQRALIEATRSEPTRLWAPCAAAEKRSGLGP